MLIFLMVLCPPAPSLFMSLPAFWRGPFIFSLLTLTHFILSLSWCSLTANIQAPLLLFLTLYYKSCRYMYFMHCKSVSVQFTSLQNIAFPKKLSVTVLSVFSFYFYSETVPFQKAWSSTCLAFECRPSRPNQSQIRRNQTLTCRIRADILMRSLEDWMEDSLVGEVLTCEH